MKCRREVICIVNGKNISKSDICPQNSEQRDTERDLIDFDEIKSTKLWPNWTYVQICSDKFEFRTWHKVFQVHFPWIRQTKSHCRIERTKFSFFCVNSSWNDWRSFFLIRLCCSLAISMKLLNFFPVISHILLFPVVFPSLTEYNRSKNIINADHHIKLRTYGTLLREKKLTLVLVCARVPTHALWLFCNSKCRWLLNRTHSLTQFNRSLSAIPTALFPNLFSLSTESNVVVSYNCHYHSGW